MKEREKEFDIITNTPLNPEMTMRTDLNSKNVFGTEEYYPGDSVEQHKYMEESNEYIAEKEIAQQRENL
ncbi:hypothetical protein [Pseudalkalibacillus caeni]|uniref:Uncharacterized protein n=1 Tax=Exobacillus caeni TaxID=2574798 RepID=A0A5R9FC84_9BACL|nr:hypothetical protein [Pseudalkalibacillus caeni]TLS38164.1 hypothetical protein FCL54_06385 [Pseudalkalibacillus caeni]